MNPEWKPGKDGLPIHEGADPKCKTCRGFGVVEDYELSAYASVLVNCPNCVQKKD